MPIEYRLNGVLRFGQAMTLEDFESPPVSAIARTSFELDSSSSTDFSIVGFFGLGIGAVTDHRACNSTSSSACSLGTEFINYLKVHHSDYIGPFVRSAGAVHFSGTQISWTYLPDVDKAIDGSEVFVYPDSTDQNFIKTLIRGENRIDCNVLKNNPQIVSFGKIPASTMSASAPSGYTIPTSAAIFVCPTKGDTYFQTVASNVNLGGQGQNNSPYLILEGLGTAITRYACVNGSNIQFKTYTCSGSGCSPTPYLVQAPLTLNLQTTADVAFYSDSSCSTALTSTLISSGQSSSAPFYLRVNGGAIATFPFSQITLSSTELIRFDQGSYSPVTISP